MKQVFTWICCVLLFATVMLADAAAVQSAIPEKAPKPTALSKEMHEFGEGANALIAVRLPDKSIVSGYIAESLPDGFVVVDPNTGSEAKIAYTQVVRLEGYNLVTGKEVHHRTGWRARLVRGIRHVLPIQPVQQNDFRKGVALAAGVAVLVAIILIVKLA